MSRVSCAARVVIVLTSLATLGGANFLRNAPPAGDHASASHMEASVDQVRQALLEQIQGALGDTRHATQSRVEEHESALKPMFAALPKNDEGLLEHSVVRYALHRYFAQRHGWSVKGLDPAGGSWNASSPSSILQDRVPGYVQELFEKRLNGHGLGLHDLAALTATLEHLVHDDAFSRLDAAYRALGLSTEAGHSEEKVLDAVDTYMMMFVLGQDIKNLSAVEIQIERSSILETYPSWNDTRDFVRDVYQNVTGAAQRKENPLARGTVEFGKAKLAVEALQDQYGPWQDRECRGMKNALLKMEENNNGRVRLTDFYGRTVEGGWQFSESIDYLRQLGALDESKPEKPTVMVANYMNSASNCLASTGFYSVCCINECEGILGEIERQVAAPMPLPEELAAIVSGLPSATVAAPRNLSAPLLNRLGEIAEHHGGQVPLHGRLFSQWLHHAFPRECPYPHTAGSTNPMTPEEWMASGKSAVATKEVLEQHAGARGSEEKDLEVEAVLWVNDEELVRSAPAVRLRSTEHFRTMVKGMFKLMALVAVAGTMMVFLKDALPVSSKKSEAGMLLPLSGKHHCA